MNRLDYLKKFMLFGVLFLLSAGVLGFILFDEIMEEIDHAEKKLIGLKYNGAVRESLELLQEHRDIIYTSLNGSGGAQEPFDKNEAEIGQAFIKLEQLQIQYDGLLQTSTEWNQIKTDWSRLLQNGQALTAMQNYDLHTQIIANLLKLKMNVTEQAGLKLGPGQDSYQLIDFMIHKLPPLIESTSRTRRLGAEMAAKNDLSLDQKNELILLSGSIQAQMDSVKTVFDGLTDPSLQDGLYPSANHYLVSTQALLHALNGSILQTEPGITIAPADFNRMAAQAIHSAYTLYDAQESSLQQMLQERIDSLQQQLLVGAGTALAIFVTLCYLIGSLYESMWRAVQHLKRAAAQISNGDLLVQIDVGTRDELHEVGEAFNTMVTGFRQMMSERQQYEEKIKYHAFYDALTGLPNRVLFNDRLQQALERAKRDSQILAVLFLDLDRFKFINDTMGHEAGDELLQQISGRLKSCLRAEDTVSRLGGDEFLIILPRIRSSDDARKVAETILRNLSLPLIVASTELVMTGSVGISLFPVDGDNSITLMKHADTAMYAAKNSGKNGFQFYNAEMNTRTEERLKLEMALRKALDRGEFTLLYQPRYHLQQGRVSGMEALVRWQHADLGLVPPSDFIPLAEECGLIVPLGEWVLRTACLQNKAWQASGLPPVRVSVNISLAQFRREEFVTVVQQALEAADLDPSWLELELTESIVMNNAEMARNKLEQLRKLGLHISLDDFGTGFSSLSYLKYFPLDTLKIDRSFIKDTPFAAKDTAITKTIISLGRRLNLNIVAEGVETEEQLAFLVSRRCNEVQGYLISKPLSVPAATDLLQHPQAFRTI
ncbi:EAL domain-containing protein [Paenibacillus sp. y28]|uniref:EAL domain-containing protein n=1 Tax=Paenibacillus sp. y28 TaxID=3129110 RepID=UPI00301852A4